jgi:hypothetical protein
MTRLNQINDKIRKILLEYWDPIGIHGVPAAHDEYDGYTLAIARMILDTKSRSEISAYLLAIETGAMGLRGDEKRALSVADRLLGLAARCD